MSIVARAFALVTPSRPARVSGACMAPLNVDPYITARTAADGTIRTLMLEATQRQCDQHLSPALRQHYRLCSSVYWLECVRRGIAQAGDGWEVLHDCHTADTSCSYQRLQATVSAETAAHVGGAA